MNINDLVSQNFSLKGFKQSDNPSKSDKSPLNLNLFNQKISGSLDGLERASEKTEPKKTDTDKTEQKTENEEENSCIS